MNCPKCKSNNVLVNAYRAPDGRIVHDCRACDKMFKTVDKVDKKQVKK